jgi:hypothetical protein
LPPVQQGCEFNSLDSAGNSETKKQPVEMCFYRSARHVQLTRDFGVVAPLQKQLDDLLFARAEPNGLFPHQFPHILASPPPQDFGAANCSRFHSIHNATLRHFWL